MEVKFGYKKAEVGVVPEGWRNCDISDLCMLQRGFDLTEATRKSGTIPVYSSSGLSYFHNEAKLQPPAVITGRKGLLGRVFFIEESCWPHDTTLWVKDFKGNDPKFVSMFLSQFKLERFDAATSVPTLNRNNLVGHPIQLPPLPEQRAIATALSDVDALLGALEQLIAKKRDLKQAAMQQLLTGKTRLPGPWVVKSGYKQTGVGLIPEGWKVKPLQDVFVLKSGFAFSSDYFANVGPIVLTPGNFLLGGGLYFEDRNTTRYSGSYSPKMVVSCGDLLIVMTDLTPDCNLLGKPAFVDSDEIILHNQRIGKVILKDNNVELQFLFYMFISKLYLSRIKEQATGSTVRHTSNKSIYSVELAWPSLPEQHAIASVLGSIDAELVALEQRRDKIRLLKQAMMQELLTGRTRLV